jgi:hypothetical protein
MNLIKIWRILTGDINGKKIMQIGMQIDSGTSNFCAI